MQKISQGRRVGIFPLAIINIHDNRKIDNNSSIKVVFIPQSGQQDSSKKYTQRFRFLEDLFLLFLIHNFCTFDLYCVGRSPGVSAYNQKKHR